MKQATPLQPRQGASCPLQPRLRSVMNKRIRMFIKFGMTHVVIDVADLTGGAVKWTPIHARLWVHPHTALLDLAR